MSATATSHSLRPRRGFHSTLSTVIALDPPGPRCSLFALYTLPQGIIVDRHELADRRLSFEFWGESNLELPVFALDQTAKSTLLVNATPGDAQQDQVVVDVPLHARYGEPRMAQTHLESVAIPSPACFWACPLSANVSSAFSSTPPVANSTMLDSSAHFLVSSAPSQHAFLRVPVASRHDLFAVEMGTAAVILAAFLSLLYHSWRVAIALQSSHRLKEQ